MQRRRRLIWIQKNISKCCLLCLFISTSEFIYLPVVSCGRTAAQTEPSGRLVKILEEQCIGYMFSQDPTPHYTSNHASEPIVCWGGWVFDVFYVLYIIFCLVSPSIDFILDYQILLLDISHLPWVVKVKPLHLPQQENLFISTGREPQLILVPYPVPPSQY